MPRQDRRDQEQLLVRVRLSLHGGCGPLLRPGHRLQLRVVSSQQTGRLLIEASLLLITGHLSFDRQVLKLLLLRFLEHFQFAKLLLPQQVLVVDAAVVLVGVEYLVKPQQSNELIAVLISMST